jgi:hypothetical protein
MAVSPAKTARHPIWSWPVLAAGAAALVVFARHEARLAAKGRQPLIDPGLLARPGVRSGLAGISTLHASYGGLLFTTALYLQHALGQSALASGLTFAGYAAGFATASITWTRLPAAWQPLASPPDRLTDIGVYQRILADAGEHVLADQLHPDDLSELRALRSQLGPVFAVGTVEAAVGILNPMLREAVTVRLTPGKDTARWDPAAGQRGMTALRTRLLAALAVHLVRHGTARLGTCQAAPCNCVYVDHSRARTRRYCCDQCNDRAAAAAYRQRRTSPP